MNLHTNTTGIKPPNQTQCTETPGKIMVLGRFHLGRENENQLSYSSCRWASCHSSQMKGSVSHSQLDKESRGGDKAQQHPPHIALCSLGSPSSNTQSILPAATHGVTMTRGSMSPVTSLPCSLLPREFSCLHSCTKKHAWVMLVLHCSLSQANVIIRAEPCT